MPSSDAAQTAHDLLLNEEVVSRLGLDPAEASRLALALVADADQAPDLAVDALSEIAERAGELEQQDMDATATPVFEDGEVVFCYQLSDSTRRCLRLLQALREIATEANLATERAA